MVATIGRPRKYGFFEPPVNIVKETPLCDRMEQIISIYCSFCYRMVLHSTLTNTYRGFSI